MTALKTLSLRIRGYDEETEQLSDDVIEATGKVADLTKVASNNFAGVSLWADAEQTKYRSLKDYLGDISKIWDEIDEKSRTDLLDSLFGKRGASVGSAILGNFDQVERAIVEMENAFEAADNEMKIVEDSIEFKLNRLKQTWIGLLQELIDRGDIGELIDSLTDLSEALATLIKQIGLVPSLGIALGGLFAFNKPQEAKEFGNFIKGIPKLISDVKKLRAEATALQEVSKAGGNALSTIEAVGIASEETAGATSGLVSALAALPPQAWLVVAAITAIGVALFAVKKAEDDARKNSVELSREWSNTSKSLSSQVENYKKLKEQLQTGNLTFEEERKIKEELLVIQKDLNEQYGYEANGIDLVNGKYEKQIELLDDITKKEAGDFVSKTESQYLKAQQELGKERQYYLGEIILPENNEELKEFINNYSEYLSTYGSEDGIINIQLQADVKNADEVMEKFYFDLQEYARTHNISKDIIQPVQEQISNLRNDISTDDVLNDYKEIVDKYVQASIIASDILVDAGTENEKTLRQIYKESGDLISQLQTMSPSDEGYDKTVERLNHIKDAIQNTAGVTDEMKNFFVNMFSDVERQLKGFDLLEPILENVTPQNRQKVKDAYWNLFKLNLEDMPLAEAEQAVRDFIDLLVKFGVDDANKINVSDLFNYDSTPGDKAKSSIDFIAKDDEELKLLDDYIGSLNTEGLENWNSLWDDGRLKIKGATAAIDEFEKHFSKVIQDTEEAKFNQVGFEQNISDLNNLSSAYEKFAENVRDKKKDLSIDIADVASLRGSKEDENNWAAIVGEDEFDLFERIVTSANSTKKEIQDAFDHIATVYAEKMIKMQGATEETYNMIETQLKKVGFTDESVSGFLELQREYQKISDWGLQDFEEQIKNKTIQTKFGNVDMDKRKIITWSDELKKTYQRELSSWDYDPEVGGIDTVFGGSDFFDIGEQEVEIAYTPILNIDNKAQMLGRQEVSNYIQWILDEVHKSKGDNWSLQDILDLDAKGEDMEIFDEQGRVIGHQFIQGIIAAVGEEGDISADLVGELMHFAGEGGAIQIAERSILGLSEAYKALQADGKNLETVTNADIQALINEGKASADSAQELRLLAIEEQLANGGLSTASSCEQLLQLATAAGIAENAVASLNATMNAKTRYENAAKAGGAGSYTQTYELAKAANQQAEQAKKATDEAVKEFRENYSKLSLDSKPPGGGGGGGGGGAKDEAEETKDIMAELSSQLDEIQSKWESLTKILDNYNETGKVTIDQAQELFQTDWKYLALLGDGTGIVQNADEAFQSLAEAKINEMRVQLARNAIDAINGLNDEAEAAKYLTNAYLDLKDGALAAEEAILQMALKTKLAAGGNIAAAAEMIYKGYQNAKALTANIDYSKKDKDSDKDKDKDKDSDKSSRDSEANSKKNKYSKDFDWIERLLERLNKLTEKWTNQAERFFTYWNKNWAIDKAVQSTRNEINAHEQALVYYNDLVKNIKIKDDIKAKVQNGAIDIETVRREKLGKKVEDYVNYYDKMISLQEEIQGLYEKERDLLRQKLENITSYFDKIEDYYNSLSSLVSARIETKNASGQRTSINDLLKTFSADEDLKEVAEDRLTAVVTGVAIDKLRSVEDIEADMAEAGSTAVNTEYYNKVSERQKELAEREAKYQEAEAKISDLQQKIKEEKNKDVKKQLKEELKQAKKEKNANKLSKKEQKELDNLKAQASNMESLGDTIIDSAISSLGSYQELQQEIGKLQSKNKLSKKESTRLQMLQDMFADINEGVAAESLQEYMDLYEDWWSLTNKEKNKTLSVKERQKLNDLNKRKQAIEDDYISTYNVLEDELKQVDILNDTEKTLKEKQEELQARHNDLEDSYNKQLENAQNEYQQTSEFKKLKAEYDAELEKKNDGKKYNKEKLARLEEELKALEAGATVENIKEYIKTWEKAYKSGTQDSNDTILLWNKAKRETIDAIKKEKDDVLREVELEQEKAEADAETSLEERKAKLWSTAKEIANWQVTSIQYMLDALDTVVNKYKSVVDMLESTDLDRLKDYGIIDFLGLDNDSTIEELLESQLTSAITATEKKIPSLIEQGNLLQELIDAGNSGKNAKEAFSAIFAKYRESSDEETKARIDNMVKLLAENDYTENEWMQEWQNQLEQVISQLGATTKEVQDFKDQLRENVYFKAITNSLNQLDALNNKLSAMSGLIKDEWTVTTADGITEYGLAKVNLLASEMRNAREQVSLYGQKIQEIERLGVESYGSQEKYTEALTEAYSSYYSALTNVESIQDQIYQIGKKAQEQELEATRKVVDEYKKALQAKSDYFSYDKTLREKSKSIEAIKSELNALQRVSDAASKSRVRQLQEQLQEAETDLQDTKRQHEIDLINNALDDLISRLEEALDDTAKSIDESFKHYTETVTNLINSATGTDTNSVFGKIYDFLMNSNLTKEQTVDVETEISTTETPENTVEKTSDTSDLDELNNEIKHKEYRLKGLEEDLMYAKEDLQAAEAKYKELNSIENANDYNRALEDYDRIFDSITALKDEISALKAQTNASVEASNQQVTYKNITVDDLSAMGYNNEQILSLLNDSVSGISNSLVDAITAVNRTNTLLSTPGNNEVLGRINNSLTNIQKSNESNFSKLITAVAKNKATITIDGRSTNGMSTTQLYNELKRLGVNITYG